LGWGVSKRGIGVSFGPDVTSRFLDANKIALLVRSHEMKEQGYEVEADNRLITVFSAPNYCDQMGNLGAYIRFSSQLEPRFYTFTQVSHPNIPPMASASNGLGSMGLV
jgi:serine/threonine-protein phosphatase 5